MSLISKLFSRLRNRSKTCPDIDDDEFLSLWEDCRHYTMTSMERMYSLYQSIKYVTENNLKGEIVECGVWKGGSAMLIAKFLVSKGLLDKNIYLYDTYDGMPEPSCQDIDINGATARSQMDNSDKNCSESVWCLAGLEEVKSNLEITGYPMNKIKFVVGRVEDNIPKICPENISLLRLDTDWYSSTRHELEQLYPKLEKLGVLIIDDYGHWQGCKKAVDEYFAANKSKILFHRIDYTGRAGIKV